MTIFCDAISKNVSERVQFNRKNEQNVFRTSRGPNFHGAMRLTVNSRSDAPWYCTLYIHLHHIFFREIGKSWQCCPRQYKISCPHAFYKFWHPFTSGPYFTKRTYSKIWRYSVMFGSRLPRFRGNQLHFWSR